MCRENEVYVFIEAMKAASEKTPKIQIQHKTLIGRLGPDTGDVLVHRHQAFAPTGIVLTGRYAGRIARLDELPNRPFRVARRLDEDGGNVEPYSAERSMRKSRIPPSEQSRLLEMLESRQGFTTVIADLFDMFGVKIDRNVFTKKPRRAR